MTKSLLKLFPFELYTSGMKIIFALITIFFFAACQRIGFSYEITNENGQIFLLNNYEMNGDTVFYENSNGTKFVISNNNCYNCEIKNLFR